MQLIAVNLIFEIVTHSQAMLVGVLDDLEAIINIEQSTWMVGPLPLTYRQLFWTSQPPLLHACILLCFHAHYLVSLVVEVGGIPVCSSIAVLNWYCSDIYLYVCHTKNRILIIPWHNRYMVWFSTQLWLYTYIWENVIYIIMKSSDKLRSRLFKGACKSATPIVGM